MLACLRRMIQILVLVGKNCFSVCLPAPCCPIRIKENNNTMMIHRRRGLLTTRNYCFHHCSLKTKQTLISTNGTASITIPTTPTFLRSNRDLYEDITTSSCLAKCTTHCDTGTEKFHHQFVDASIVPKRTQHPLHSIRFIRFHLFHPTTSRGANAAFAPHPSQKLAARDASRSFTATENVKSELGKSITETSANAFCSSGSSSKTHQDISQSPAATDAPDCTMSATRVL